MNNEAAGYRAGPKEHDALEEGGDYGADGRSDGNRDRTTHEQPCYDEGLYAQPFDRRRVDQRRETNRKGPLP